MTEERFRDRRAAGRELAARLHPYAAEDPLVIALPRGGVPVAFEIAAALDAPLDVLVVRKLGAPGQPELAIGAIGPGQVRVLSEDIVRALRVPGRLIDEVEARERRELERRERLFRSNRPFPNVRAHTVVLVDNGMATGSTAIAAVQVLRHLGARRIVLAVAVLPRRTLANMRRLVDEVVYLKAPEEFAAVGQWYDDFRQTTDDEVLDLLELATARQGRSEPVREEVRIPATGVGLSGTLEVPPSARGLVIFAHGSGSSRFSRRNRAVAASLRTRGLATLLFDLLTDEEDEREQRGAMKRFDVALLARRLQAAARWARAHDEVRDLPIGYFGASTGAGAAIVADAYEPGLARAVVSRGGRPDLAADALSHAEAPTLLVVGGRDTPVIAMNRDAQARMNTEVRLEIVPGATHLFEEPGALEQVAALAGAWFEDKLSAPAEMRPALR